MSESSKAKQYFKDTFIADDLVRPLNSFLVDYIYTQFKPTSLFEFGCGQGKNLQLYLGRYGNTSRFKRAFGIDVSEQAIIQGRKAHPGLDIVWGDELVLSTLMRKGYDVSFTCSVLDHVPEEERVRFIIEQLIAMSVKGVVLCETQADKPEQYYYSHSYENLGFSKLKDFEYYSDRSASGGGGDGNTYFIYTLKRSNP